MHCLVDSHTAKGVVDDRNPDDIARRVDVGGVLGLLAEGTCGFQEIVRQQVGRPDLVGRERQGGDVAGWEFWRIKYRG